MICITAGFREVGGEGADRERKLLEIVDKYNMCMTGPNCMGLANTNDSVRLSATILDKSPRKGHVAFLTQSGALGASLIDFADELDVGFSVVVSLGNMANINPCDLLPMLEEDDANPCVTEEFQVFSDKANYNIDLGFVCRREGVMPDGVGEGKTQKWKNAPVTED